ncbi:hypothetical protein [Dictyobacter kobayashii]|uniref:Uncharacterized protein n=1 Tax=Dictyobacter kobayashii TaxID=2014872 RepID=A0A402AXP8_9CHLR|nr:hypothetical protein [Dictyobacter kobayashii]GCE23892.1 hypothetical protein KDK_76920 [Dictyobacter kobayashii]
MPAITNKQDIIAYFEEKKQRKTTEGDAYIQALDHLLALLNETESISAIKSAVRTLHRNELKEIQNAESAELRIELRKKLALYDDCLMQLRNLPAQA